MSAEPAGADGAFGAVDAVVAALRERGPETRAAVGGLVSPEVEVFGPFGIGHGLAAVEAMLDHPAVARLTARATWSLPERDGDLVTVSALAPPQAGVGGFRFGFRLDADGLIDRIEQDLLPARPAEPSPLVLTDAQIELLAGALANGTPMTVTYVDAEGSPHVSYRAAVLALGPDQLGMWVRDPNGGLLRGLAANPHLTFFYSDRPKGVTLQFAGRGHVEPDETVRAAVYDGSPEVERTMDWRRRGVAVVVDLDRVEGRDASGRVLMTRTAVRTHGA